MKNLQNVSASTRVLMKGGALIQNQGVQKGVKLIKFIFY